MDELEQRDWWTMKRWMHEGRPANQPFHIRHNPKQIPLSNKDLAKGRSRLLDIETERFMKMIQVTCNQYGLRLFDPPGLHKASHEVVNVDRLWPGVYSVTASEEKWVQVSISDGW